MKTTTTTTNAKRIERWKKIWQNKFHVKLFNCRQIINSNWKKNAAQKLIVVHLLNFFLLASRGSLYRINYVFAFRCKVRKLVDEIEMHTHINYWIKCMRMLISNSIQKSHLSVAGRRVSNPEKINFMIKFLLLSIC